MAERKLEEMGVAPHAATLLVAAVRRAAGIVVICGPTGVGKTTLAEVLVRELEVPFLGDLRMPDEITAALRRAARDVVLAVVRSGESHGLFERWHDMEVPDALVQEAAVTTVTLRRLPATGSAKVEKTDLFVVEVLGPNRGLLTGSLVQEADALVASGVVTDEAVRFHLQGYG